MKEKLKQLVKNAKTLKQVEKILKSNKISYEWVESIGGKELKIIDANCYYRIFKRNGYMEVLKMVKHSLGGGEALLKAKLIHERLSYF